MNQCPACQEAYDDTSVLTWLTPNHGLSSVSFWASTHCLMVTDMTEGLGSAGLIVDAWTDAALVNAGKGIIAVIVGGAFRECLGNRRFCRVVVKMWVSKAIEVQQGRVRHHHHHHPFYALMFIMRLDRTVEENIKLLCLAVFFLIEVSYL